jgi:hypothetical protein
MKKMEIKGFPTIIMAKGDQRLHFDAKITQDHLRQFIEQAVKL